jgi:hypothetical protein
MRAKYVKNHVCAHLISKIFPGFIPRTPVKRGGTPGREGKRMTGTEEEGKRGERRRGKEGERQGEREKVR